MPAQLDSLQPGLMILQGNRLEDLRDLLTEWIKTHPLRPLEDESILVQSNGIAQWLKMALARDDGGCGIAAAMQVDLPGRFLWQAYRSVFDDLPEISPYDKAPLTWRLYRLLKDWPALEERVQELGENPELLQPLKGFLSQDADPRRLHQLAANLADLYDQYQVYRADWLEAWEANLQGAKQDELITAKGKLEPLETADRWQPLIWRLLVADIQHDSSLDQLGKKRFAANETDWTRASRASIHRAVIKKCKEFSPENRPEDLPRRVLVFGISSLPRQTLELFQALSPFTQILVFASNPCQHYWGDLVEDKELLRREYQRITERKIDANLSPEDLHLQGHPLLASWGKQGRDYLHLLDEQDEPESYREQVQEAVQQNIDLYRDPLDESDNLLSQLQSDIFDLRPLSERQQQDTPIDPEKDRSLEFLIAHSPQREVEILHDQLLATFEQAQKQSKRLPPREVLVMVPDINVYAPHIQAVFGRYAGQGEERDPRFLPFHIADQGQRGQNTLLIALEKLLQLPSSRFAVSELLDLLDTPALRQRYRIAEADLPRLREWIQGANIRWGLNAEQRADLGLPKQEQNTWLFGLRRLLLGFASGSSPAWKGIEPHDEVAGLEAALLGPLAQLLKDLETTRDLLKENHTPAGWSQALKNLIARFFTDTSKADTWAITNLDIQLEKLEKVWEYGKLTDETLPLEVIREELLSALDQPTLTQKFLGGSINFATLMPMRAIPFQQVWLLGMNDGDYPRSVRPADFDLMAKDYRPGDRSRREDDRYLFLEALLSAREKLVISWVGRNIRDNSTRPPSVLVGQLRDHLAAGWQAAGDQPLLDALTTEHPLQAFSPRYFVEPDQDSAAAAKDQRLVTFAHEWQQLFIQNPETTATETDTLPAWYPEASLALRQLNDLLRCPADAFYKDRLKIYPEREAEQLQEVENFAFSGLEAWVLQDQLIQQTFHPETTPQNYPHQLEQALDKLVRQGTLIEGALGRHQSQQLTEPLLELFETWQQERNEMLPLEKPITDLLSFSVEGKTISLELSSPYLLVNSDASQYSQLIVQTSRAIEKRSKSYAWRNLTRPWLHHLAAQVLVQQPVTTQLLTPKGQVTWPGLSMEKAQEQLSRLVTLWWQSMQKPLPTALSTGMAWVASLQKEPDNLEQAANKASEGFNKDCASSARLGQVFPDFDCLHGQADFASATEALYEPLYHAVKTEVNA
ncbi:DNA helicase/exodeoxyribonuclease V, gamma subunit [Marinospirillum celere]|uniref:RecBCD enzyme subunit RecC n=1 Tax=Marinospirillum celere TaxID=1122252 RepID=A0A1I1EIF0_9GAMM|nr:exodeoxyribonuclease V subunit gamma [Marinospirillum celere]SFB86884.1 DNA helicase/exodeoxyribonuclease V, gamma subunit [Marinospirillum celere]